MNNSLFTVTSLDIINELKGYGINKFVYPLSFFCVGIPNTFNLSDIKEDNSYIYVNRILDTEGIDKFKELLPLVPNNVIGIIFDDMGLIEVLKDTRFEKILFQSHFCNNYESINYLFDYVDEIIVSLDITEEEIDEIIKYTKKEVSFMVFGLTPSMYSRRTLMSNYAKHYGINNNLNSISSNNQKFITVENDYGTVLYHYPYYNGLRLLNKKHKYSFYYPILLDNNKIIELLNNNLSNIDYDYGFLDTKTIYKIKKEEK